MAGIESLLQQRQQARAENAMRKVITSGRLRQRIRDELLAVGITPIDRPDGQIRWERSI